MPDDLEERLRSHAKAFDGLLSLIPAKLYYGEDVSDQWKRKKQTPEQKRAARMAKLDPDNIKSAKDVMDERAAAAKKRKRGVEEASRDPIVTDNSSHEEYADLSRQTKKRKMPNRENADFGPTATAAIGEPGETEEQMRQRKAERKAAKRERQKTKTAKAKEKIERQKAKKRDDKAKQPERRERERNETQVVISDDDGDEDAEDDIVVSDLPKMFEGSSASPSPPAESPILSPHLHSGSSSISSIQTAPLIKSIITPSTEPLPTANSAQQPSISQLFTATPESSTQTPHERLEARLALLRQARKADLPDGRPVRNRQELLESRRRAEEARRAAKKEQRRIAKEEAARKMEEEIVARFSPGGSGSLLASPRSPMMENNFSFGRVAFADGSTTNATLSDLAEPRRKKGAADPATALKAAQAKAVRLSGLDEEKRADIANKDMWLNAKKRAHGERVRDDTSLLKKALKRQEMGKRRSEKDWAGRMEAVEKGKETRQKRREENLKKRREEKCGKKGGGKLKGGKVKRPGFEGSFKGRTGGKKK